MFLASGGRDEFHDLVSPLDGFSVNSFAFSSDSSFSDSLFSRCSYDTDSVHSPDLSTCFSSPSVVSDSLSEVDSTKESMCLCDDRDPIPNIALPPLPERDWNDSERAETRPQEGFHSIDGSKPAFVNVCNTYSDQQRRLLCKQRYAFSYASKV